MRLVARLHGLGSREWPKGLHWVDGEIRDVDVPKGAKPPAWLEKVAPKKKKG